VKVVIADEAEINLEDIADRNAVDSPVRAVSFVRELRAICGALAELPSAWPLMPGREPSGVRRRVHGNYLIFFQIEKEQVTVVRILHGARDYEAILFPNG
jgi:plasmid stabilization system protein ParE